MSEGDTLYVANARLPSRKAHPYQIVQMCDAFAENGRYVELVVPNRRHPDDAPDSLDYYDSPLAFEITRLPCVDFLWLAPRLPDRLARVTFYIQTLSFTLAALVYIYIRNNKALVYSRTRLFTVFGSVAFPDHLVTEIHRYPSRRWVARLTGQALDRTRGVVVISEGLREEWTNVTTTELIVEPDAVRLSRFEMEATPDELRVALGLPDGPIACYAGSLKPWKGVDTLIRAAHEMPEVNVCIVGGSEPAQQRLQGEIRAIPENVRFVGHVPPADVPRYLIASDVLVLPNTETRDISMRFTSPLKLFEYMAAGRPIVASDLPAFREILEESTAVFVRPDDPSALATGIKETLADPEAAARRAENARVCVKQYTWSARAERIIDTFNLETRAK